MAEGGRGTGGSPGKVVLLGKMRSPAILVPLAFTSLPGVFSSRLNFKDVLGCAGTAVAVSGYIYL